MLAHLDVWLVARDHEAGVGELVRLFGELLDDLRCAVAHVDHGDAGPEVDEGVAVDIDDHPTAGPVCIDGDRGAPVPRRPRPCAGQQGPLNSVPGISVTTSRFCGRSGPKFIRALLHLPFLTVAVPEQFEERFAG